MSESVGEEALLPAAAKHGLYKTEMCKNYMTVGFCAYGSKCQFAHGGAELRRPTRHPKFKTQPCKNYWMTGSCPYGVRCHFMHDDAAAMMHSAAGGAHAVTYGHYGADDEPVLSMAPPPPLLLQHYASPPPLPPASRGGHGEGEYMPARAGGVTRVPIVASSSSHALPIGLMPPAAAAGHRPTAPLPAGPAPSHSKPTSTHAMAPPPMLAPLHAAGSARRLPTGVPPPALHHSTVSILSTQTESTLEDSREASLRSVHAPGRGGFTDSDRTSISMYAGDAAAAPRAGQLPMYDSLRHGSTRSVSSLDSAAASYLNMSSHSLIQPFGSSASIDIGTPHNVSSNLDMYTDVGDDDAQDVADDALAASMAASVAAAAMRDDTSTTQQHDDAHAADAARSSGADESAAATPSRRANRTRRGVRQPLPQGVPERKLERFSRARAAAAASAGPVLSPQPPPIASPDAHVFSHGQIQPPLPPHPPPAEARHFYQPQYVSTPARLHPGMATGDAAQRRSNMLRTLTQAHASGGGDAPTPSAAPMTRITTQELPGGGMVQIAYTYHPPPNATAHDARRMEAMMAAPPPLPEEPAVFKPYQQRPGATPTGPASWFSFGAARAPVAPPPSPRTSEARAADAQGDPRTMRIVVVHHGGAATAPSSRPPPASTTAAAPSTTLSSFFNFTRTGGAAASASASTGDAPASQSRVTVHPSGATRITVPHHLSRSGAHVHARLSAVLPGVPAPAAGRLAPVLEASADTGTGTRSDEEDDDDASVSARVRAAVTGVLSSESDGEVAGEASPVWQSVSEGVRASVHSRRIRPTMNALLEGATATPPPSPINM